MPSLHCFLNRDSDEAFCWTNIDTRFASSAGITDHGVDLFGRTDDGISGADFITSGAADAGGVSNFREYWFFVFHIG